ncbi:MULTISPECIES: polymorphic toxin type 44 domain-containing protein [unclassified Neisseria]|uniref:polymorphic toxin type 44 domain-containing protein n=1 Tax=unclassified Neisseria TaxID=2623750 RepID=UPI0026657326|nr:MULTISPECIES: polymorphic toxin type 44 domain-containing protein [unclassified Neisseria]MDO1509390.1 polymorphic toxin type 44 domain-containing protein [Neisseria sp. MVDL19-042950]MDO1515331.1 polymorphic toxin type 44 domain-containing protein [Neisseria sp. MVDL18-041461]MDO1562691.1 polymorphic toxin type 44 domain-containing protein [Neisseria sp. MVDL20-010259]
MAEIDKTKTTKGRFVKGDNYLVVQKITQPCEHKIDGAVKVAEYIVDEIKRNVKSKQAEQIRYYNDHSGRMKEWQALPWYKRLGQPPQPMLVEAMIAWTMMVRQNGPWDHKPIIRKKFSNFAVKNRPLSNKQNAALSQSHYHKYKKHDYFYDVWSNIHYGYVGMACGFSASILLDGAGLEQIGTNILSGKNVERTGKEQTDKLRDYDNIADRETITLGVNLFKDFGIKNISKLTMMDVLQRLEMIPFLDDARVIHLCFDKNSTRFTKE